jgi:GGDEF domain-containing protein
MAAGSSRPRRFSLPDLADDRVEGAVTAFLHGPERGRGRPDGTSALAAANPFAGLQTRIAWTEALGRESARHARYRRHAAILVIAVEPSLQPQTADGWVARLVGPVAHAVRRGLRDTDLVTRASDARFHVLMPETTAKEAQRVADRVVADCSVWLRAMDAPVALRAAVAAASQEVTLEQALARAVAAVSPDGRSEGRSGGRESA